MKAINDWVFVEPLKSESSSGILTASMERGTVLTCSDDSLLGKEVLFDINKVRYKTSLFWIVDIADIFGVEENDEY